MSELQKFLFEGLPVRGAIVRIDTPWQDMLARRAANSETGAYPEAVQQLLGEMTAAGVLMQAAIQFEGALVMQIQGGTPLRLAVAEVSSDLRLRATAQLGPGAAALPADADIAALVGDGQARCAITLDADEKRPGYRPYQGIVPLQDESGKTLSTLSQVLTQYMRQSEQLDTVLVLAANDKVAAGLMVQRMPIKGKNNLAAGREETEAADTLGANEDYNRIATLAASLQRDELLTLDIATILRRLFWQEPLTALDTGALMPHFGCQCSRERVAAMLRGLGREEIEDMLQERQPIEVGCEFCGAQYHFDAVDAAQLFNPLAAPQDERRH